MLRKLNAFAKKYTEGRVLGEEFLTHMASDVVSELKPMARIRLGMMANQLTASESKDGIAKMMEPSIILKLKSSRLNEMEKAEAAIETGENAIAALVAKKKLRDDDEIDLWGVLVIRITAFLAGKGSKSIDQRDFASMDEIIQIFVHELAAKAGVKHDRLEIPDAWKDLYREYLEAGRKKGNDNDKEGDKKPDGLITLDDLKDPTKVLERKGIKVGEFVSEKRFDTIYQIKQITGKEVHVQKHNLFEEARGELLAISVERFLSNWAHQKKFTPQELLPADWEDKPLLGHPQIKMDEKRLNAWRTAQQCYRDYDVDNLSVRPTRGPLGLRAMENFGKDELIIVPFAPLRNLVFVPAKDGPPPGSVELAFKEKLDDGSAHILVFQRPQLIVSGNPEDWKTEQFAAAFWYVRSTPDQSLANMRMTKASYSECFIPILTNTRKVTAHEELLTFAPKTIVAPLAGVAPVAKSAGSGQQALQAGKSASKATATVDQSPPTAQAYSN